MKARQIASVGSSVASIALALFVLSGCADLYWAATGQPSVFGKGYKAEKPEPYRPGTKFYGLYYSPTDGRVGYHLVSNNLFRETPSDCKPGPLSDLTATGTAPPGITVAGESRPDGTRSPNFEGTPRQAGDWDVTVTMYGVR